MLTNVFCGQGSGDCTLLTGALRDAHVAYKMRFNVRSSYPGLFEHHPAVELSVGQTEPLPDEKRVEVHINQYSDDQPHFQTLWHKQLSYVLGVEVPMIKMHGALCLSAKDVLAPPITGMPYWLMFACGKVGDFTVKWWDPDKYQAVVDHFRGCLAFVQVGAGWATNFQLRDVIPMAGQTTLRDVIRLAYHADGVLTSVSFGMHLAAATVTKPGYPKRKACVVIAGGGESPSFVQYPAHTVLHSVGTLPCCASGGCWKLRVETECEYPRATKRNTPIARCMDEITVARVIEAIEQRYRPDGRLVKEGDYAEPT